MAVVETTLIFEDVSLGYAFVNKARPARKANTRSMITNFLAMT
jgi:hypothetical protein